MLPADITGVHDHTASFDNGEDVRANLCVRIGNDGDAHRILVFPSARRHLESANSS